MKICGYLWGGGGGGGGWGVITKSDFFLGGGGAFLCILGLFKVNILNGNIFGDAKFQFLFLFFFFFWGGGMDGGKQ